MRRVIVFRHRETHLVWESSLVWTPHGRGVWRGIMNILPEFRKGLRFDPRRRRAHSFWEVPGIDDRAGLPQIALDLAVRDLVPTFQCMVL